MSNWKVYSESFLFDCKLRNLSKTTIKVYNERLGYLKKFLDQEGIEIEELTKPILQKYILSLIEDDNISDETVNGRIRAFRRFFNYLIDESLWEKPSPCHKMQLVRVEKKVRDVITADQVSQIARKINRRTFCGIRNLAMLMVFWDGMIRKSELTSLELSNVDLSSGLIKVYGKGRKERFVPIGIKTVKILHQYLIRRSKINTEFVFCTGSGYQLTERHCHHIIRELGVKIGVKLYPHLIRHSAVTHYLRIGGNPSILEKILGHTSPIIIRNYTHLNADDMVESYMKFSPSHSVRI